LQQGDQYEDKQRGQVEGDCTDSQRGKKSPDRSEDGFGQVIQDSVQDGHTLEARPAGESDDEIKHNPAE